MSWSGGRERAGRGGGRGDPNLAARLQGLAEPGAVVVAEEHAGGDLGGLFALPRPRCLDAQGFRGAGVGFRRRRRGAAEGRFEARHGAGLTPLVGREQELALLLDRWERAKEATDKWFCSRVRPGSASRACPRAMRERLGGEAQRR